MALDLSLRGSGVVLLPYDWIVRGAPWGLVRSWRFGEKLTKDASEADRAHRNARISQVIGAIVVREQVKRVFIEGYAFDRQFGGEALAELGGVVRRDLIVGLSCEVESVVASAARKLLFGVIKRGTDIKKHVAQGLTAMGAAFPTQDEADAFVIANYGLTCLPAPALIAKP